MCKRTRLILARPSNGIMSSTALASFSAHPWQSFQEEAIICFRFDGNDLTFGLDNFKDVFQKSTNAPREGTRA